MSSSQKVGIPLYNAADPSIISGKVPVQAMIEKIDLFSTADSYTQPYDITKVVTELELTESIYSLSVIGSITIIDNFNLFQDARIHGQEKIKIKVRRYSISDTSYSSIFEKEFLVTNLRDYNRGEFRTMFTLEFASPHVFKDKTKRISRAYGFNDASAPNDLANSRGALDGWKQKYGEMKVFYGDIFAKLNEESPSSNLGFSEFGPMPMEYPEQFVYNILKNDLNIDDENLWLYGYWGNNPVKPSAEKMKLVVPNWRPFQTIRWLLRNTFSNAGQYVGHPWFCYDTILAGIRIEPYTMLVKKYEMDDVNNTADNELFLTGRTTKEVPDKFIYNPYYTASPESEDYFKKMHKKIFEIEIGFSFNTFERAGNGSFASQENYADVFTKWTMPNSAFPSIAQTNINYSDTIQQGRDTITGHYKPYSSATLDLIDLNQTNYTYYVAYNSALHGTTDETRPYNKPFGFSGDSAGGYSYPGGSAAPGGGYQGINPQPTGLGDSGVEPSYQSTKLLSESSFNELTQEDWNTYRHTIGKIENSGQGYDITGGASNLYHGAYQMGVPAMKDASRILGITTPSITEFRNDWELQERMFDAYTKANHGYMMSNPTYASLPQEEKLAMLGYAHNSGHGPAKTYLNTGDIFADDFGTKSIIYYNGVLGNLQADSSLADSSERTEDPSGGAEASDAPNVESTVPPPSSDVSSDSIVTGIRSVLPQAEQNARDLRGGTLSNGCAAHTSSLLQLQGFDVASEVGAQNLANQLEASGFERIPIGQQQPGDIGVTADWGAGAPGADHVYTVTGVDPNDPNNLQIVDNQYPSGGTRPIKGGGKTDTEYFLRPPYGTDAQGDSPSENFGKTPEETGGGGGSYSSSGSSNFASAEPESLGKLGRTGDMLRRNIAFMSHTIKILGDFKINPGSVIYIDVQKSVDPQLLSVIEGIKENTSLIDEYISGQYFVTECTHAFKEKTFYSYVTINRDSSSLDLENPEGLSVSNQQVIDTNNE